MYISYWTERSFIFSLRFLTGVLTWCVDVSLQYNGNIRREKFGVFFGNQTFSSVPPDLRRPEPPCCWQGEGCVFSQGGPPRSSPSGCVCLRGISRCKCGGSRWLRKRRCTWGTSSDGCRSASWRTRSRKRGSTWSAPRPSPSSCSTDMLNGPAGGKKWLEQKWWAGNVGHTNVFKSLNGKFEINTLCARCEPKQSKVWLWISVVETGSYDKRHFRATEIRSNWDGDCTPQVLIFYSFEDMTELIKILLDLASEIILNNILIYPDINTV